MKEYEKNIGDAIARAKAHLFGHSNVTVELLLKIHDRRCYPRVICHLLPDECGEGRPEKAPDSAELVEEIGLLLHSSFKMMYSRYADRAFGTACVTLERTGGHVRQTAIRFEDRFPGEHDDWGRTKYR